MKLKPAIELFLKTISQLKFTIITIASVLGFAFVTNYSGMSITIAVALAGTGMLFPLFSPLLGWLGVFLTGSDTSSNALFCRLQYAIGIDPVVTVSSNATGGVTGKMISPQSIAVGTASTGLVGKESELFRFTLKHSFIMLSIVCVITFAQAYIITWIIPEYKIMESHISEAVPDLSRGLLYTIILAIAVIVISLTVLFSGRRKSFH
jgi:lactate permease